MVLQDFTPYGFRTTSVALKINILSIIQNLWVIPYSIEEEWNFVPSEGLSKIERFDPDFEWDPLWGTYSQITVKLQVTYD